MRASSRQRTSPSRTPDIVALIAGGAALAAGYVAGRLLAAKSGIAVRRTSLRSPMTRVSIFLERMDRRIKSGDDDEARPRRQFCVSQ
jgi:hypothetical protein